MMKQKKARHVSPNQQSYILLMEHDMTCSYCRECLQFGNEVGCVHFSLETGQGAYTVNQQVPLSSPQVASTSVYILLPWNSAFNSAHQLCHRVTTCFNFSAQWYSLMLWQWLQAAIHRLKSIGSPNVLDAAGSWYLQTKRNKEWATHFYSGYMRTCTNCLKACQANPPPVPRRQHLLGA